MNKKIFVVSDTDREYTERFIRCLEAWEGSRFEIRGFTEKEYLSEQSIGFREIYDGEQLTVQFTIAKK